MALLSPVRALSELAVLLIDKSHSAWLVIALPTVRPLETRPPCYYLSLAPS